MFCCLGLFAGLAIGSLLGGPWVFIGPSISFILGLFGDMKLLHSTRKSREVHEEYCCDLIQYGKAKKLAKDPVCGMDIDEKTTKYKVEYKGKTYYFCSSMCESDFKKKPEKYMK